MRRYLGAALLIVAGACNRTKTQAPVVQTAVVQKRDIIIDAQATGVIEPINVIEVKSKAGGAILKMPVETGTLVKPGDLLVQVDPRDAQNQYNQAKAQLDADEANMVVQEANKKRQDDLFKSRVITAAEHENAAIMYENAKSAVVRSRANLDIKQQALEDATVSAPVAGTIIDKTVSVGTVIASASTSVSGGTTLLKMANLSQVRVRALFNETDIGNVRGGQPATVTVDAYPDRRFTGLVEKIEPQAVVQQNVTMFPVLVTLNNEEGLLRPGMNGEVAVLIDERDDVLAVPNDAVKNPREVAATALLLGLNPDSAQAELRAQFGGNRGGGGGGMNRGGNGGGGGGGGGGAAPTTPAPAAPGGAAPTAGGRSGTSNGDVSLIQQQAQDPQQGDRQGRRGGGGFGNMQPVSDAECKKVDDVLAKHPKEKKQLDDLRGKMMAMRGTGGGGGGGNPGGGGGGGNPEMRALSEQMRTIYGGLGLDPRTAGQCLRRASGDTRGGPNAGGDRRAGGQTGAATTTGGRQGGAQRAQNGAQLQPSPEVSTMRPRTRQGLVFVADSANHTYHPRAVQLGQGNFDYTEVVSGLKEGEHVVLLASLALQAQRQQQNDRARANASPLGGQQPGPGGRGPGGPGGGGGGGGAPRGGGGR